jgi:hypothetical protein
MDEALKPENETYLVAIVLKTEICAEHDVEIVREHNTDR